MHYSQVSSQISGTFLDRVMRVINPSDHILVSIVSGNFFERTSETKFLSAEKIENFRFTRKFTPPPPSKRKREKKRKRTETPL